MSNTAIEPVESKTIRPTREQAMDIMKPVPSLPPLSDADMQRARVLSRTLIRRDDQLDDIVVFGNDAQSALAQISKDMLRGVRATTLDDVIQLSDGVLVEINALNLGDLAPAARRYLLILRESAAAIQHRVERFFTRFDLVNSRLDRVEAEIFAKETASTQRYYADSEMGRAAVDVILEARIKLAAIKLFLNGDYGYVELDRRREAVAQESAAADREHRAADFLLISAAERYARYLERLEMKAASLEQLILSAYQTTVTLRMMQDNESIIRQKLSDIHMEVLPQWRHLITIAYQAYLQHGTAKFVQQIAESERDLRMRVADRIEGAAVEIATLKSRQTFDLEAMAYYNDKLIHSLEILKTASIEAKKSRDVAEESINRLIEDLTTRLTSTSM